MNLVRCSCGWTAVDKAASALGTQVKLALTTMVEHWEDGHTVKAAAEIYLTVRAAALDLAVEMGIDVGEVRIPFAPRGSRPSPFVPRGFGYRTDDLLEMFDREMRRRHRRSPW